MSSLHWHKITPGYAQAYNDYRGEYSPASLQYILQRAEVSSQSAVILDLACGTGAVTRQIAGAARLLIGMDSALPMLIQAKQQYPEWRLACADGVQLPLPPGSLDLVTIGQAIHWFDLPALFGELRRVLRPDGWLAVLSRYPSPAGRLDALVERLRYPYTEEGRQGTPQWSTSTSPSNLLGLAGGGQIGFDNYDRTVFEHTMELSVAGYLRGSLEGNQRHFATPAEGPAFRADLEAELNAIAEDGILREPFFDYVFMARKT
jgi:ubiquinone/menaquinone biosynthesis C-methylase UbiE